MRKNNSLVTLALCAAVLLSVSSGAQAAATWNFGNVNLSGTNSDGCNGTTSGAANQGAGYGEVVTGTAVSSPNSGSGSSNPKVGNAYKCKATTGTGPDVTVTAWGKHNSLTGFQAGNVSPQGDSGFGVKSHYEIANDADGSPHHSMDNSNSNGTPDMFLLSFGTAVSLSEVVLGWTQSDADFTLMAYNGPGAPPIGGKTASDLRSTGILGGWVMVENSGDADDINAVGYGGSSTDITRPVNVGTGTVLNPVNTVTSSWWLISAYNSGFGGGELDNLSDYIKLLSVSSRVVPTTGVPEPGSMALMGMALVGVMAMRRRKASARH